MTLHGAAPRYRCSCLVPGCNHTKRFERPDIEWVCADHWRLVPPWLRRRKSRLFARYRRLFGDEPFWKFPPGSERRLAAVRMNRLLEAVWRICRRAAIERSMGL